MVFNSNAQKVLSRPSLNCVNKCLNCSMYQNYILKKRFSESSLWPLKIVSKLHNTSWNILTRHTKQSFLIHHLIQFTVRMHVPLRANLPVNKSCSCSVDDWSGEGGGATGECGPPQARRGYGGPLPEICW